LSFNQILKKPHQLHALNFFSAVCHLVYFPLILVMILGYICPAIQFIGYEFEVRMQSYYYMLLAMSLVSHQLLSVEMDVLAIKRPEYSESALAQDGDSQNPLATLDEDFGDEDRQRHSKSLAILSGTSTAKWAISSAPYHEVCVHPWCQGNKNI
jgi:hypothetical protein